MTDHEQGDLEMMLGRSSDLSKRTEERLGSILAESHHLDRVLVNSLNLATRHQVSRYDLPFSF